MFNDDFFLNDDELAEDNQITIVDTARTKLLESIIKSSKDMIDNLKFNEQSEAESNTRLISSYVDSLLRLGAVDLSQLSEEEAEEEIDKILKSTTELTFSNMNDVLPEEEPEISVEEESDESDGTDW